jgi:hypothetical protein
MWVKSTIPEGIANLRENDIPAKRDDHTLVPPLAEELLHQ